MAGGNLVENPGFESGDSQGWVSWQSELAAIDSAAREGVYSVRCFNRGENWQGPLQNMLGKMQPGQSYQLSGWVRMEPGAEARIEMSLAIGVGGDVNYVALDEATVGPDEWVKLEAAFRLDAPGDLSKLDFYFQGPPPGRSFLVDDVRVVPQALLHVEEGPDGRTRLTFEDGSGEVVPGAEVIYEVSRLSGERVAGATAQMGEHVAFALPEGTYRAHAYTGPPGGDGPAVSHVFAVGDAVESLRRILDRARDIQADPERRSAAGWIDYLAGRLEDGLARGEGPVLPPGVIEVASRLAEWTERIAADPEVVSHLRGMREWAHLSRIDGTGQPFLISIPEDYDATRTYPLLIYLHGLTRTHLDPLPGEPGRIECGPLGRSRAGWYCGLSEADVLECLAYVRAHWNIDPNRVHIYGTSMGGGGSFGIASRHPDLFASARPQCGYGLGQPLANLLHVPVRSLHSIDDPVVPVIASRGAAATLNDMGYAAIQDETDGLGHAVWDWREGIARADQWQMAQVRPETITRVHYAATDELARGAYWVEVIEWGPEPVSATIEAEVGGNGILSLSLLNVITARFDLGASCVPPGEPLAVVVNGQRIAEVPAPLPDEFCMTNGASGWRLSAELPEMPAYRLHFPGGAMALYHGEPVMVVWGTTGTAEENAAMRSVAETARRSCDPRWPDPQAEVVDGVPMQFTLYGRLPGKADTEVTDEDMQRHNLLLMGTAEQNAVVARLADRLPVTVADGKAMMSDGAAVSFQDRALGLLYYNPVAPERLIYWVASASPDFYKPGARLMELQSGHGVAGPDFMVIGDAVVVARHFDSRWNWEPGYAESPVLTHSECDQATHSSLLGEAVRKATDADFALIADVWDPGQRAFAAGETRRADVIAAVPDERLVTMDLTRDEILRARDAMAEAEGANTWTCRFFPPVDETALNDEEKYRVVAGASAIFALGEAVILTPDSARVADVTVRDALLAR